MALLLLQMKKIRRRGLFGLPWVAWCCLLLLATIVEWVQTSRQAGMRALVLLGRVWGKEGRKTGSISTSRNLGRTRGIEVETEDTITASNGAPHSRKTISQAIHEE